MFMARAPKGILSLPGQTTPVFYLLNMPFFESRPLGNYKLPISHKMPVELKFAFDPGAIFET
jgi:hypothetical protein